MRFLVTFRAFDTIVGTDDISKPREVMHLQLKAVRDSGKLVAGGMFAEARGGFFVLDVGTPMELKELLGPMHDYFHMDAHAVCSLEEMEKLFQRYAAE